MSYSRAVDSIILTLIGTNNEDISEPFILTRRRRAAIYRYNNAGMRLRIRPFILSLCSRGCSDLAGVVIEISEAGTELVN